MEIIRLKGSLLLQALALLLLASSLWSSPVQGRVLDLWEDEVKDDDSRSSDSSHQLETEDTDDGVGDGDDVNWPVLCPEETFYDKTQEHCVICSQCPMNQVITSPCQGLQDTQCGPFLSFQLFKPSSSERVNSEEDTASSSSSSSSSSDLDSETHHRDVQSKPAVEARHHGNRVHVTKGNDDDADTHDSFSSSSSSGINARMSEKQSLSILLVIIFVIASAVCVLVVAITCYVRQKAVRAPTKEELLCQYQPAPPHPPVAV